MCTCVAVCVCISMYEQYQCAYMGMGKQFTDDVTYRWAETWCTKIIACCDYRAEADTKTTKIIIRTLQGHVDPPLYKRTQKGFRKEYTNKEMHMQRNAHC